MAAIIGFFIAMYVTSIIIRKEVEKDTRSRLTLMAISLKYNAELRESLNKSLKTLNMRITDMNEKLDGVDK